MFGAYPAAAHNGLGEGQIFFCLVNRADAAAGFETGFSSGGGNGFENDVGRFRCGGNRRFPGRSFDKADTFVKAQAGCLGNSGSFCQFSGFKNDFGGGFAAGFGYGIKETVADVKIAFKKIVIRKNGVNFIGAGF